MHPLYKDLKVEPDYMYSKSTLQPGHHRIPAYTVRIPKRGQHRIPAYTARIPNQKNSVYQAVCREHNTYTKKNRPRIPTVYQKDNSPYTKRIPAVYRKENFPYTKRIPTCLQSFILFSFYLPYLSSSINVTLSSSFSFGTFCRIC